jgi:DnaJ-class molecular chaperone
MLSPMSKDFLGGYKTYDVEEEGLGDRWQWKKAFKTRMTGEEAKAILNEDDPYVILGVNKKDTRATIKKAFYALAMLWHPDKNPHRIQEATIQMQKINAAYTVITEYW